MSNTFYRSSFTVTTGQPPGAIWRLVDRGKDGLPRLRASLIMHGIGPVPDERDDLGTQL